MVTSCSEKEAEVPDSGPALVSIRFQPDWFLNAQFAGILAAEAQGFYAEEGVRIALQPFDFSVDFLSVVKQVPLTLGTAEGYILLQAAAEGRQFRALTSFLPRSPAGYLYDASNGLLEPTALVGKRVGVHKFAERLLPVFLSQMGAPADAAEAIEVEHAMEVLADGRVDFHQAYAIEELLSFERISGRPGGVLLFEELGLPLYSMVVYTSATTAEQYPDEVAAFLRATRRGWEWAFDHPTAMLTLLRERAGPGVDTETLEDQLRLIEQYARPGGEALMPALDGSRWQAMAEVFHAAGMIDSVPALNDLLP